MGEKPEGQRVRGSKEERLGAYGIRENRTTAADEEICRPSGFAAADGSWRVAPARVGRRWATKGSRHRVIGGGFFVLSFTGKSEETKGSREQGRML